MAQDTSRGITAGHARRVAYLSEAHLLTGRLDEAADLATSALAFARTLKARGNEAYALWLQGESCASAPPGRGSSRRLLSAGAHSCHSPRDAAPPGALHRSLGTLYAATGEREQCRSALSTAVEMYRAMDMTFWLPQTEAALAQARKL